MVGKTFVPVIYDMVVCCVGMPGGLSSVSSRRLSVTRRSVLG